MKKVFVLFVILVFLSCFNAFGQTPMPVIDAGVNTLLAVSGFDQFIYYGQQVQHNVESLVNTIAMVSSLEQQIKMAAQNMASIGDIESWSDFMDWYNRQLYLERRATQIYQGMNVKIGSESYHLTDVVGLAQGYTNQTKEFWEGEFTEDQRKEMWLELGLTPSNYAYVQPFREKAMQIAVEGLSARELQNEWYMRIMQRVNQRQRTRAEDKYKPDNEKMGSMAVQMQMAEALDEINKVMNDIAMQNAQMLEMQAVKHYQDQAHPDSPVLSTWGEEGFSPLIFDFDEDNEKK